MRPGQKYCPMVPVVKECDMSTLHVFCPYDNFKTCPRLKRTDSPRAARPFYIVDEDHPRGVVFLDQAEVYSLATGGTDAVGVSYEGTEDVLIVDSFGNEIRMTRTYFDQLRDDINAGLIANSMDQALAVV